MQQIYRIYLYNNTPLPDIYLDYESAKAALRKLTESGCCVWGDIKREYIEYR